MTIKTTSPHPPESRFFDLCVLPAHVDHQGLTRNGAVVLLVGHAVPRDPEGSVHGRLRGADGLRALDPGDHAAGK